MIHLHGTSRHQHPACCRGWRDGGMDGVPGPQLTPQPDPGCYPLSPQAPARSRWFSPQVNLCQAQEFRYRFPIKGNVSGQIRQKFIIFRYQDFLHSVKPLVNNSDLLQISYCIHKGREVSDQRNYQKKYFHNFAGAQITAYGRGLKG